MASITLEQVADLLGVPTIKVERLTREKLLVAIEKDESGKPLFNEDDIKRYKVLAERLGGL